MLGLLVLFSFWIAISIVVVVPLVLVFACGGYLAEKLDLDGLGYYIFMVMFYLIILGILIII